MSDAINAAAGAGTLLAGATPFGWAQLATQGLGALASTSKPAGPSEASGFFGSTQSPFDSSGWTVNFGDNANQDARTGDRGGPSLTPSAAAGYAGGSPLGISPLYLVGGAVLLLLLWRKR